MNQKTLLSAALAALLPIVLALASCSALPGPTALQTTPTGAAGGYGPVEGESELTFAGALGVASTKLDLPGQSTQTDVSFFGQAGYGHYLTNEHEIGGQVIFNLTSPDEGDDFSQLGFLPYYRYNFRNTDRTWFYAGVHAGAQKFEQGGSSDDALSCGIHGGMKSWLTPQVSFFVEPRLTFASFDIGPNVTLESRDFRTLFGFSYTF